MRSVIALLLLTTAARAADLPSVFALPQPPGQYAVSVSTNAQRPTFHAGDPCIATTYFYWYDIDTKLHILDGDGTDALTNHPPTLAGLSYKSIDWHSRQLSDMIAAGI